MVQTFREKSPNNFQYVITTMKDFQKMIFTMYNIKLNNCMVYPFDEKF